jgi:transcriptional regulator with XRE-family HTH domain
MNAAAGEQDPSGAFVHRLRLERGITQESLAFEANVTIATLSRIERGVTAPKVGTLRKIATALGMSLAELVMAVDQEQH